MAMKSFVLGGIKVRCPMQRKSDFEADSLKKEVLVGVVEVFNGRLS
jgi:hypothetical protein